MARTSPSKKSEYRASYSMARGLCPSDEGGLGYLENMYIDYSSGMGRLESIPGYRSLLNYKRVMNGIHVYNKGSSDEIVILHIGSTLYYFNPYNLAGFENAGGFFLSSAPNIPSTSLCIGNKLYIFTGQSIMEINSKTSVTRLGSEDHAPYVPTVYENGEKKEERNLLTDKFIERYTISSTADYLYESAGIHYRIDEESGTCTVTGADAGITGVLHIPAYTTVGGKRFAVVRIAENAFEGRSDITELVTAKGLSSIGKSAFKNCKNLGTAVISDTVEEIGKDCFAGCTSLLLLFLGIALKRIGAGAFAECESLDYFSYSGDAENIQLVEGYAELDGLASRYLAPYEKLLLALPVHAKYAAVSSVAVDGKAVDFSSVAPNYAVLISVESAAQIVGKEVVINATFGENDREGYLTTDISKSQTPLEAITKCTLGAFYGGHILLSGNKKTPRAVFYSAKNEDGTPNSKYFPAGNYFMGNNGSSVVAIMNCSDTLAVFNSSDNGTGSITHRKMETKDDKIRFPEVFSHSTVESAGATLNYYDDHLFYCNDGVYAIEKKASGDYKITSRSSAIRSLLAKENPKNIVMTEWQGYVVLLGGEGRMYLGDRRTGKTVNGNFEYAWYPLTGIGCYEGDQTVYRYAPTAPDGFTASDSEDKEVIGTVMSVATDDGSTVYYVEEGGEKIAVYPTEEKRGGSFSAPIEMNSAASHLFFSDSVGNISVFNTDKRGVAPKRISSASDFNPEEYARAMGNKIHPDFYSFASHAPRYAIATVSDDMNAPHLRKLSVSGSLAVKCESLEDTSLTCEIETDSERFCECLEVHPKRFGFDNIDFSRMSLSARDTQTFRVPDPSGAWTEKRILLYSDKFRAPISVYSIDYRYRIKGNIS